MATRFLRIHLVQRIVPLSYLDLATNYFNSFSNYKVYDEDGDAVKPDFWLILEITMQDIDEHFDYKGMILSVLISFSFYSLMSVCTDLRNHIGFSSVIDCKNTGK